MGHWSSFGTRHLSNGTVCNGTTGTQRTESLVQCAKVPEKRRKCDRSHADLKIMGSPVNKVRKACSSETVKSKYCVGFEALENLWKLGVERRSNVCLNHSLLHSF